MVEVDWNSEPRVEMLVEVISRGRGQRHDLSLGVRASFERLVNDEALLVACRVASSLSMSVLHARQNQDGRHQT